MTDPIFYQYDFDNPAVANNQLAALETAYQVQKQCIKELKRQLAEARKDLERLEVKR